MALLALCYSALIFDFVLSVLSASKLSRHIAAMDELNKRMRVVSDGIGEPIAERVIELKDRLEEKKPELEALEERLNALSCEVKSGERRLLHAFPDMQGKHLEGIASLREKLRKDERRPKRPEDGA